MTWYHDHTDAAKSPFWKEERCPKSTGVLSTILQSEVQPGSHMHTAMKMYDELLNIFEKL